MSEPKEIMECFACGYVFAATAKRNHVCAECFSSNVFPHEPDTCNNCAKLQAENKRLRDALDDVISGFNGMLCRSDLPIAIQAWVAMMLANLTQDEALKDGGDK